MLDLRSEILLLFMLLLLNLLVVFGCKRSKLDEALTLILVRYGPKSRGLQFS